ncbi:D-alanyl-D-alanine carboxypeptidase family protein [Nocardia blacklockiae]|uniref:D-alanyl-D-alanine carboxypeptidase family protein n=1 Tax=Nocardia blacklockiae TaxID=480036 RepID=UPI0018953626|nr:D-alanyl-D-alanine carboxypeptidase family protein [Nocardia blacklockiae]MBF6172520.1 serine hydrolase [Nocardia blacklockiae]
MSTCMTRRFRRSSSIAAAALTVGLIGATALTGAVTTTASAAPSASTTAPFSTPNTDSCPNKTVPPPAIDTSEVPAPGEPTPTPLPVPSPPIGGDKLGGCGLVLPEGAPPVPAELSATAWVIADLDTGRVLAAKDPHGRYRPASTIKVLLAAVALRSLDLDKVVVGTQDDANADGTRVGIGPGGRYTNRQLMQALIMASGNDAAHAIATQLGGEKATVAKMNELAKRLHAMDTRAATPSGLDGPGMSTSAYDLAALFRESMTIPTFAELVHTEQVDFPGFPANPQIPGDQDHPGFPIANDNHLLYDYEGTLGGKTGYTDDARQTFVTAAERGGHRLVVTLLQADVRPIRPPQQAARLLDYGFALASDASVGTLPDDTAKSSNTNVAVASPPPRDTDTAAPAEHHDENLLTVLIVGGLAAALVLAVAAWKLTGRSRR